MNAADVPATPSDGLRRRLSRDSAGVLVLRLAALTLAFGSTVLAVRLLGPGDYGVYAWATSVALALQMIAVFGFDRLAVRELGQGSVTGAYGAMSGVLVFGRRVILVASVVVIVCVGTVSLLVASGSQQAALLVALVGVPLLALTTFRQGVAQGLNRVIAGRIAEDLGRPVFLSLLFLAALASGQADTMGSTGALALQTVAILLAFIIGTAIVRSAMPDRVRQSVPVGTWRRWTRQAFPLGLVASGEMLLSQLGIILLGLVSTSHEVAAFAVAMKVAVLIALPELALNSALMPTFARLQAGGEIDRVRQVAAAGSAAAFVGGLTLAVPLLLIPGPILSVFGSVPGASSVLLILALSWLVSALGGVNGALLMMSGRSRPVVWGISIALATNLLASLALIPTHGAVGAAWAWLLTLVVWNGFLAFQVRRQLGFWASPVGVLASRTSSRRG